MWIDGISHVFTPKYRIYIKINSTRGSFSWHTNWIGMLWRPRIFHSILSFSLNYMFVIILDWPAITHWLRLGNFHSLSLKFLLSSNAKVFFWSRLHSSIWLVQWILKVMLCIVGRRSWPCLTICLVNACASFSTHFHLVMFILSL